MQAAHWKSGFTLVEVVVALIITTLIVGGVMGLASVSLQNTQRMKEKLEDWPVLEAAAQKVLAHPEDVQDGPLQLSNLPGAPRVLVSLAQVPIADDDDGRSGGSQHGDLYRVELYYNRQSLEFSIVIPRSVTDSPSR